MKLTEVEDQIYVMKSSTNAAKVLQTIAESGVSYSIIAVCALPVMVFLKNSDSPMLCDKKDPGY